MLAMGLALSEETGQAFQDAQLRLLEGELILREEGGSGAAGRESAEAAFRAAAGIARSQGARSFELRALTRLVRLRASRGRRSEAVALLEPLYRWFTEGFETTDLRSARSLLAAPD